MPSNSYYIFLDLLDDVDMLIATHQALKEKNNKKLGHLTRSGVLMLCASWELYHEELVIECIKYLSTSILDATNLPKQVKKTISKHVEDDKNEIKAIELAGNGWKNVWHDYAKRETILLNTPKSVKLKLLYKRYLGINDVCKFWKRTSENEIDNFVSLRGEIAHKGKRASYVRMNMLKLYYDLIRNAVIDNDSEIAEKLKKITNNLDLPWDKTYLERTDV